MSRISLLEAGAKSEVLSNCNWTRTHNHLVCNRTLNHLAKLAILFINNWAVLWVLICTVHLAVFSCHVTYAFESESTLLKLPECQGSPCSMQARNLKFKWLQLDSNPQPLSPLRSLVWLNVKCSIWKFEGDNSTIIS